MAGIAKLRSLLKGCDRQVFGAMESMKPYDISQALQIKPENRKHALGDSLVLHHVADARVECTAEWQAQNLTQVAQLVC